MNAAEPDLGQDASVSTRAAQRERVKVTQDVAAALAHELRTPVFAVASAAQLLRYRITDDPVVERNIGRILREAERLNALITALVEYGRPAPVDLAPGDPDDVWTSVIAGHRGDLEAKALLVEHTAAEPRATCNLDRDQLSEAFANALTNAIEASPDGGDLRVNSTRGPDGAWTCTVHNDGPPIRPQMLPRVFEPLVGSKPGHAGTGLANTHRIVSDHGGAIAIDSAAGAGTTLTFTLPAIHG